MEVGREIHDEKSRGSESEQSKSEAAGFEDGRRGLDPRNPSSQQKPRRGEEGTLPQLLLMEPSPADNWFLVWETISNP